jgi:ADP-ribose pyrophosphatase YjhB (NUDIX family)
MNENSISSTRWRPHATVRPIAIGIVRRGDEILVMAVRDDAGSVIGWRPLGGAIEFGERAADALKREFIEELGSAVEVEHPVAVLENLYSHHGAPGHEIVFVFDAAFADAGLYARDRFTFEDGGMANEAEWVPLERFDMHGETLFPVGLIEHI